jgi:FixJ family two-component response regulator
MTAPLEAGQTVLVVDDDDTVRTAMLALLRAAGLLDGADPVQARCAVVDIHIGEPDGFALRERLRALAPRLPVIFVSGDDDPALARRAGAAGALALLHKPVDADCLLALIDAIPAPPDALQ